VVLLLGGYFFLNAKSKAKPQVDQSANQQVVQKLSPEDLGLSLTALADNKAVKFTLTKIDGIKTIEYELTYEADSTAQEQSDGGDPRVQRGITGSVDFASVGKNKSSAGQADQEVYVPGEKYQSAKLDLGSCSKNICRYDTGVKSVDLTLKIVKTDGKTYSAEEKLDL
jgi:hypothetical protein